MFSKVLCRIGFVNDYELIFKPGPQNDFFVNPIINAF